MNPNPNYKAAIERAHRIRLLNTRRVWAAVTRDPCITVLDLAAVTGLSHATVHSALRRLRGVGYIDFAPCAQYARTIVVPFITGPIKIHRRSA